MRALDAVYSIPTLLLDEPGAGGKLDYALGTDVAAPVATLAMRLPSVLSVAALLDILVSRSPVARRLGSPSLWRGLCLARTG